MLCKVFRRVYCMAVGNIKPSSILSDSTLQWGISSLIYSILHYHGTLDIMSGYPAIIACLDLFSSRGGILLVWVVTRGTSY